VLCPTPPLDELTVPLQDPDPLAGFTGRNAKRRESKEERKDEGKGRER